VEQNSNPKYKLAQVLEGWEGYQASLLHAVSPLTPEHLSWRPAQDRRSVGELVRHISLGRLTWLARLATSESAHLPMDSVIARVPRWHTDGDGARHVVEDAVPCDSAAGLEEWLTLSWQPIQQLLDEWTVDDLFQTYPHRFRGVDYGVSRQWTVWRIFSHDTHHGGQLAMMLAMQGVAAFELRALGGHIIAPKLAGPRS
jgi:uncharacterized damage-inducible protein DinB